MVDGSGRPVLPFAFPLGRSALNALVHYDPSSDAWTKPLEAFDVSDPALYQNDIWYTHCAIQSVVPLI